MSWKAERRIIGGVEVRRITDKEYNRYFCPPGSDGMEDRGYYLNNIKKPVTQECFPDLRIAVKRNLNLRVCHYAPCKLRKKKAICCICLSDGSMWKAPSHKIGKCPFLNYF